MWPCKSPKKITHKLVLQQQLYTRFDMMRLINDIRDIHGINLIIVDEIARYESKQYTQLQALVSGIDVNEYVDDIIDDLDCWCVREQIFVEYGFKKSS